MVYVKSILVSVIALLVASVLYLFIYVAVVVQLHRPNVPSGVVSVDASLIFGRPFFWLVALLSFAIAFYWEFRRASR